MGDRHQLTYERPSADVRQRWRDRHRNAIIVTVLALAFLPICIAAALPQMIGDANFGAPYVALFCALDVWFLFDGSRKWLRYRRGPSTLTARDWE